MRVKSLLAIATMAMTPAMFGGENPAKRLDDSADVLKSMMKADDKGVPQELIEKAQCVVVIPNVKKAGFIVGAKYGKGFVMCRKMGGPGWSAPAAISVEGGSFGFLVGGAESDVILVVQNKSGEEKLLQDKFTIGGDATAAAGPVGRDLSAQTDAQLHAEILSYSRSRGLFAGIAITGATLRPDNDANKDLYGHAITNKEILNGDVPAPAAAAKLEGLLNRNSMHKEGA